MIININKRYAYAILGLLILSIGVFVVNALTPGVAPNPGHVIDNVAPPAGCVDGQVLQFIDETNGWGCVDVASGGTDTNANTECAGIYTYLSGDGECRDVRADGDLYDTDTTVISGVLYGWCQSNSGVCYLVRSPAYCSGTVCACPSGYTRVVSGEFSWTDSDFYGQSRVYYSCYKN